MLLDDAPVRAAIEAAVALRVSHVDWRAAGTALDADGVAIVPNLLTRDDASDLAACYDEPGRFRSRVIMQRHRFGRGEYQYFRYSLPPLVQLLREQLYERLAPIANRWAERLGATSGDAFPPALAAFLRRCHDAGQHRPTPLLLRYETGDYNCLHQDLYGEHVFPLQVVILLSEPGRDFDGGELVLVEQRPRAQSAARVVALCCGDAAIIATHHRPERGARGWYRVNLKHGVSHITRGHRCTAGIIFHDAAGPADD
jgi:hypothetical protein